MGNIWFGDNLAGGRLSLTLKTIQNGRLNSLLYIRLTTAAGVEVEKTEREKSQPHLLQKSGHIDLADRVANQVLCELRYINNKNHL